MRVVPRQRANKRPLKVLGHGRPKRRACLAHWRLRLALPPPKNLDVVALVARPSDQNYHRRHLQRLPLLFPRKESRRKTWKAPWCPSPRVSSHLLSLRPSLVSVLEKRASRRPRLKICQRATTQLKAISWLRRLSRKGGDDGLAKPRRPRRLCRHHPLSCNPLGSSATVMRLRRTSSLRIVGLGTGKSDLLFKVVLLKSMSIRY